MRHETAFAMAAAAATKRRDKRTFRMAALAVRGDGAVVCSTNLPAVVCDPRCHAEQRLSRKLDVGATVYVVRIGANGEWRLARPCSTCFRMLSGRRVRAILYTIAPNEYGVIKL